MLSPPLLTSCDREGKQEVLYREFKLGPSTGPVTTLRQGEESEGKVVVVGVVDRVPVV